MDRDRPTAALLMILRGVLLYLVLTLTGGTLASGDPQAPAAPPSATVAEAKIAPRVSAQPDDPAWSCPATMQLDQASIGTPISLLAHRPPPTEVRMLWDPKWLYCRFTCEDDTPPYLPPGDGLNTRVYQGDAVEVFLDPVGDSRQWFEFQFNARNDRFGQVTVCSAKPEWDANLRLKSDFIARNVWTFPLKELDQVRSAARWAPSAGKWIVDVAIPAALMLKRTGGKNFTPMQLRGNFLRYKWVETSSAAKRQLLSLNWSPIPLYIPHRCPAAFGFITLAGETPSSVP